jgi:hypothetical protein
MSVEEFKAYVISSGVNFDELTNVEKVACRAEFDRSRQTAPAGKSPSNLISLQQLIFNT